MSDSVSDDALRESLRNRRKYIQQNLDNLTMKACRKLLEEDLGLPEKSLANRKEFIQKYIDKIIEHKASKKSKGASDSKKQTYKSAPAAKKQKASADDDSEESPSKQKAEPRTSKTIEKVKQICKAATIKIPPSIYVKSKSLDQVEADMADLLAKHGLSLGSASSDISQAATRLNKERELEGIDVSNIVQGGRRARRGAAAAAPINYAAIDKASTSSDDEDEAGSAEDQSSSDTQDSDAAGSAEEEEAENFHDDHPPSDMETDKTSAQCTGKTGKENGNIIKRKAVLYDSDDE